MPGGSIGGGGGAVSSFTGPNTMRTRVSAGDQYAGLGGPYGGGGTDVWGMVKNLRAEKERARREAAEWDARFARGQEWKDTALSAAPPSRYNEIMGQARADADAERLKAMNQWQTTRDIQNEMAGRRENWYGQFTGSNAPGYADLMPAFTAATGRDLLAGRPSGWDQYAALAGAGALPGQAYGEGGAISKQIGG